MNRPPEDEDIERADALLDQADALLNRHREAAPADAPAAPFGGTPEAAGGDDLPILTEVVETRPQPALRAMLEREIAAAVEDWLVDQLPLIVDRQIDLLVERLRAETLSELRAGLAPAIAARILRRLAPGAAGTTTDAQPPAR